VDSFETCRKGSASVLGEETDEELIGVEQALLRSDTILMTDIEWERHLHQLKPKVEDKSERVRRPAGSVIIKEAGTTVLGILTHPKPGIKMGVGMSSR